MGLDDLKEFNPRERLSNISLEDENKTAKLIDLTVKGFADETSRESPAPGGGTISAYMGALGAALGTMVATSQAIKLDGMPVGKNSATGQTKVRRFKQN